MESENMKNFIEDAEFCPDEELKQELLELEEESELDLMDDIEDLPGNMEDSTSLYLKEISKYPVLTKEEETELFHRIENGDFEAKKIIMDHNLRLVVSVAKKLGFLTSSSIDFLDLIAEGNFGLMRAIETFDMNQGYKFSTYATWWIRQKITRYFENYSSIIRIPVHMTHKFYKMKQQIDRKTQELGRNLTQKELQEIEDECIESGNHRAEQFRNAMLTKEVLSLNSALREPDHGDEFTVEDTIANNDDSVEETCLASEEKRLLLKYMDSVLSQKEREIIKLRFGFITGDTMTLEEVGQLYGITRERVRQIEAKAIKKLRKHIQILDIVR